MTAIWQHDGTEWQLASTSGFDDEKALQALVDEAPQMLPLSGSPDVVVIGREVQLGSGYVDLLAIEADGRPVVIEVKLARNAEARRAVVAQALAYAAFLNELDAATFEQAVVARHLLSRGWATLEEAVSQADQSGAFDAGRFREGLDQAFADGSFRLVFVLDDAPTELVRLVGYLESVTDLLTIDLITVDAYEIGGSKVLVPQRVDPERVPKEAERQPVRARAVAAERSTPGADEFERGIQTVPEAQRERLARLVSWARQLEAEGLARLTSFKGANGDTLLPRLVPDNAGLVTVWNQNGAVLYFWRSVFQRRAPKSLPRVEELVAPAEVGQGTAVREISDELVEALTDAYREAAATKSRSAFDWTPVRRAVEAIPPGRWTSYGDLAELAGTAAITVGRFVAGDRGLSGAWRVMGADGRPRPDFRWSDPNDERDIVEVLVSEGVRFGPNGSADESQRLRSSDLGKLAAAQTN
jgi:alkylated DNA nucleotide flippase Atl1